MCFVVFVRPGFIDFFKVFGVFFNEFPRFFAFCALAALFFQHLTRINSPAGFPRWYFFWRGVCAFWHPWCPFLSPRSPVYACFPSRFADFPLNMLALFVFFCVGVRMNTNPDIFLSEIVSTIVPLITSPRLLPSRSQLFFCSSIVFPLVLFLNRIRRMVLFL